MKRHFLLVVLVLLIGPVYSQATFGKVNMGSAKKQLDDIIYWPNGNPKIDQRFNGQGHRHGEYKEYYESGEIKLIEQYEDGVRVGRATLYTEQGQVIEDRNYIAVNSQGIGTDFVSKLHGAQKEYYSNGGLKLESFYEKGVQIGTEKRYHENGTLLSSINVENGRLEGEYVEYHPSGAIKTKGLYKRSDREGLWKSYHENGSTHFEENYINNEREDGAFVSYYPSGKVEMRGQYEKGMESGEWKEFYENGQLKSEITYKQSNPEGEIRKYYENGNLMATGQLRGRPGRANGSWNVGQWIVYYENGSKQSETNYSKRGEYDGTRKEYYESGAIKVDAMYRDFNFNSKSALDGSYVSYFENGQIQEQGVFRKGLKEGQWTGFNPEGKRTYSAFFDGSNMEGKFTSYFPSGKLKEEGKYVMTFREQKHGEWLSYYENGQIMIRENFHKGDLEGERLTYHQNGKKESIAVYSKGVLDGEYQEFFDNGQIKVEGYYKKESKLAVKTGEWKYYSQDGSVMNVERFD